MKKNFKNLLTKNKLVIFLITSALTPIIGSIFLPQIVFNIVNLVILLFVVPLCLLLLSGLSLPKNLSTLLLVIITTFFFAYTPIVFIIHQIFHISLPQMNLTIVNSIIITLAIIKIILFSKKVLPSYFSFPKSNFFIFILALLIGIALHTIFFHFYVFIPETDGYSKMIEIDKVISGENILMYRGLFTTSIAIMASGSLISVYNLFSTYLIFIQLFFIILSIYSILKYIHLSKILKLFLLLSPFAIPVLNMEIDVVRPQNTLILFLFIYSALIFNLAKQKRTTLLWLLTTLIAICGTLYHELFFIIFIAHCILLFTNYFLNSSRKIPALLKWNSWKFILTSITAVALLFILLTKAPFFQTFIHMPLYIFNKISNISQWQLWFIDSYGTDTEIGWHGLTGAIKYYAYYASPLILFLIIYLVSFFARHWKHLKKKPLLIASFFLLLFPLVFAEILPRMNYFLYPERMWIFIDIILLLSFIMSAQSLLKFTTKKLRMPLILLLYLLLMIGVVGSIYIATQKKAYTSKNEFTAAQWIKRNTPENSLFITQSGNGPMINYFAQRKILSLNHTLPLMEQVSNFQECQKLYLNILQNSLATNTFQNIDNYTPLLTQNCTTKNNLPNLVPQNKHHTEQLITPINQLIIPLKYIVYSHDKFKGLYTQREWWLKGNYYGTDIDKLTKKYPLVYNKNNIYIWKVK